MHFGGDECSLRAISADWDNEYMLSMGDEYNLRVMSTDWGNDEYS